MLSGNGGVMELFMPGKGNGPAKRPDAGARNAAESFGDTLKGQLRPSDDAKPRQEQHKAAEAAAPVKHAEMQGGEATTDKVTEAEAMVQDEVSAEEVASDEEAVLLLEPLLVEATTEPVVEEMSGKILPLSPSLAAAQAAEEGDASAQDEVELPRWLRTLSISRQPAAPAAGDGVPGSGKLEQPVEGTDFLAGFKAIIRQDQPLEPTTQLLRGQGTDLLSQTLGSSAVAREVPGTAPATSTPTAAAAPQTINVPLRQPGWDNAFAERVVWMARQGLQQAEIHITPRNMGPIEVHVAVTKDQANVTFVAQHALTREALESSLPRLREMLQDNGMNLAQSEVSQHSFGQQRQQAGERDGHMAGAAGGIGDAADGEEPTLVTELNGSGGLGAVDYYA